MKFTRRTEKDMRVVRKTMPFKAALDKNITSADLKNYAGNGNVVMLRWDGNEAMKRDKVFLLQVGDKTAYIDLEELLSYTRLI